MSFLLVFLHSNHNGITSTLRDIELHDATEVLGLIHQIDGIANLLNHFLISAKEEMWERVTQIVLVWIWVWHIQHTRHNVGISKAAVLLTGFQQQGELCQLLGACINVNTCQIVAKDVLNGYGCNLQLHRGHRAYQSPR